MTAIKIERDAHSQQYVVIHNDTVRDKRLSRSARGLLAELLSLPPGRQVTADTLADGGPEGRDAIRRMLRELEEAGYITRSRERGADGRWQHRLTVREAPIAPEPETDFQSTVPPADTQVYAGGTRDGFSGAGKAVHKREVPTTRSTKKTPRRGAPRAPGGDAGLQVPGLHPDVTRTRACATRAA